MALGKRHRERQLEAFVSSWELPQSPGHPFYTALNRLLAENDFDSFVETLYAPFYAGVMGRPSIPPGIFFRMTFVATSRGFSRTAGSGRCCPLPLPARGPLPPAPSAAAVVGGTPVGPGPHEHPLQKRMADEGADHRETQAQRV